MKPSTLISTAVLSAAAVSALGSVPAEAAITPDLDNAPATHRAQQSARDTAVDVGRRAPESRQAPPRQAQTAQRPEAESPSAGQQPQNAQRPSAQAADTNRQRQAADDIDIASPEADEQSPGAQPSKARRQKAARQPRSHSAKQQPQNTRRPKAQAPNAKRQSHAADDLGIESLLKAPNSNMKRQPQAADETGIESLNTNEQSQGAQQSQVRHQNAAQRHRAQMQGAKRQPQAAPQSPTQPQSTKQQPQAAQQPEATNQQPQAAQQREATNQQPQAAQQPETQPQSTAQQPQAAQQDAAQRCSAGWRCLSHSRNFSGMHLRLDKCTEGAFLQFNFADKSMRRDDAAGAPMFLYQPRAKGQVRTLPAIEGAGSDQSSEFARLCR